MELQKDKIKLKYKNDDKRMSVKIDIMANKFSSTNIKKYLFCLFNRCKVSKINI